MISLSIFKKSFQIVSTYNQLLFLILFFSGALTLTLIISITTYFVLESLLILPVVLFILSFTVTFFNISTPFFIGSKIQKKNPSTIQCLRFAWRKKKTIFTHSILRILLFPLKIVETVFSPLGRIGSLFVRPFEFILGSVWQFSSALTPATVVFGKAKGIYSFRKTVLDTRRARGRKIRLKNMFWFEWIVYIVQAAFFIWLLILTVNMNALLFTFICLLMIIVVSVTYSLFTVCKSSWFFALYIFLVLNKVLPPFSKNLLLRSATQRV